MTPRLIPARLADGRPAYERAPERLKQSDIDRAKAWAVREVREART